MREYRTWHEILMEQLADPAAAIDYLQVTLEEDQIDENTSFFLQEIWTVVKAQGGISKLAKKTGIEPKILKEVRSGEEAPRSDMLNIILRGLGCRLSIEPLKAADSALSCANKNYPVASKEGTDPNLEVATESGDLS